MTQQETLQREIREVHWVEAVAPRQKTADWRPPFLVVRQAPAKRRRALFAVVA